MDAGAAYHAGVTDDTPLEIERTFLLDRLPDLPESATSKRIEQGYLGTGAKTEGPTEGRIRRSTAHSGAVTCTHTIKRGLGLVRSEIEREITVDDFEALWPSTEGRRIVKTRWCVPEGELTWEVDDFADFDIVLAEVELPSADTEVAIPSWLAGHVVREVTEEPEYRNYSIAVRRGLVS